MDQERLEKILLIAIVPVSSIGAWFIPGEYHNLFAYSLLGIGIFFDVMSFFYHILTILTRKYMSGFPFIGLFFYGWFILASRFSLTAPEGTPFPQIIAFKAVDAFALMALHALFQSPMFLQGSREKYR